MKKLVVLFLLIPLFFVAGIQQKHKSVIAAKSVASSGTTYDDIIFYWGAESTTAEKSEGDSTASLEGGGSAINSDQVEVGSNSLDCPTGYDRAEFDISSDDIVNDSEGGIGFYLYTNTTVALASFITVYYDINNMIQLRIDVANSNYQLHYKGNSSAVNSSTSSISTGSFVFVEIFWSISAALPSSRTLELSVNGSVVGSSTSSLTALSTSPTLLKIGAIDGKATDFHIDQVIITDDITRDLYALRDTTSF